ncbi:MAG: hypothetical protein ACRCV9_19040, partial [Burkholderiaceae bacterium]
QWSERKAMSYWQTLLLMYPLGVIGFRAGAWSYWRLRGRKNGAQVGSWREAFSDSFSSTTGAAVAMIFYVPGA